MAAALKLQAQGYLVTLCLDKHPLGIDWSKDSSGNDWGNKRWKSDEIELAFSARGDLNIGLVLGKHRGSDHSLIDIEADSPEEEAAFAALFASCEVPVTPTFKSRRGKHRLFAWHDGLEAAKTDGKGVVYFKHNGAKLGVRIGNGKQIHSCIPPSVNTDGTVREWLVNLDECEPATLPEVVVARIVQASKAKDSKPPSGNHHASNVSARERIVAACLDSMRKIDIEDGNDGSRRLLTYCCRCVEHGLDDDQSLDTIRNIEAERPFPRNWSDSEILARIRDADRMTERGKVKELAERVKIDATCKDLPPLTKRAWSALLATNNPPTLFRFGSIPTRIEQGDHAEPITRALDYERMRHHLARAASFVEQRTRGEETVEVLVAPPKDVVNDVLATPDQPLPILTRIVEAPVFAPSGELQTTPGYHPASQTFYAPAAGFTVPDVTGRDVEHARDLICDELLSDFPFVGDAELAHAVALLLLPFARDLIDGPTPLHMIEKPAPGTGATLLIDMLAFPATGRPIPTMTEGRDEDEWRKRLTAKIRSGAAFALIDNLRRELDSAAVSSIITSTIWEDRILGSSEVARTPVRCGWAATGNNPRVSTEISRRTIRIRLDARLDRPWLRSGFRHADLRTWTVENRGLLCWAALTLVKAWILKGRPQGKQTLGMFEKWAAVIGGILDVAGIPGFLANASEFYEGADAEGAAWRGFLTAWWDKHQDKSVAVRELWQIVTTDDLLDLGDKGDQSQRIRLGKLLGQRRDRIFDLATEGQSFRVVIQRGDIAHKVVNWRLGQCR